MAVTGWVLVQTDAGRARPVCDAMRSMQVSGVKVLEADTVTGPYDVIARIEADDADSLLSAVENQIEAAGGVQHTVTCLALQFG